jgi:AraC-like DNA-binding protein
MAIAAGVSRTDKLPKAVLELAHTGVTHFKTSRWVHPRSSCWVVDQINQGGQQQRIGKGKIFIRLSGIVALYAPTCRYHELQSAGDSIHESFMVFSAWEDLEAKLHRLVGTRGWCHFLDPDGQIGTRLQHLGDLVFRRSPSFELLGHAGMLELLGMLLAAPRVGPTTREVCAVNRAGKRDLVQQVEAFVKEHITESLGVEDLASHMKMSLPTFARSYPRIAGETPSRTIRRMKLQVAKSLLLAEGTSVKECAVRLGFSSEFHFSRLFKKLEGIPPSKYAEYLSRRQGAHQEK